MDHSQNVLFLACWPSGRARGRARTKMVGPRPYLVYSWRRHCLYLIVMTKTRWLGFWLTALYFIYTIPKFNSKSASMKLTYSRFTWGLVMFESSQSFLRPEVCVCATVQHVTFLTWKRYCSRFVSFASDWNRPKTVVV